MSLEVGFESLLALPFLFLSLLPTCSSRCEPSGSALATMSTACCHGSPL